MFAANIVTVRLRDRPDRHLADLGAAAHDDDPLAVNLLQRLHHFDTLHDGQFLQIRLQRRRCCRQRDFEVYMRLWRPLLDDLYRCNITLVLRNHARQLMQHAESGAGDNLHTDLIAHLISYFRSRSSQCPWAFNNSSTTSRTAPCPPGFSVTYIAQRFTSGRALAVAMLNPTRFITTTSVRSSPM